MRDFFAHPAAEIALVIVLAVGGCQDRPEDPVILEIGGRPMPKSRFEDYVREVVPEETTLITGEFKAELFDEFIEEQLLLRAAEDEGVTLAPDDVSLLARGESASARIDGDASPNAGPVPSGRSGLEVHLLIRKLIDDKVLKGVRVDEAEIATYYEENRAYYRRQEVVDVSQILVESEEEANRIRQELKARPSRFAEMVRQYSTGPEVGQDGRLGAFQRGELPTAFEKEVFALGKGNLSNVIKTDFGYHVFRVNDVHPAEDLSLEDVQDAIRVELLQRKSDEAMAAYVSKLKERYPIKVYTELLDFPCSLTTDVAREVPAAEGTSTVRAPVSPASRIALEP